MTATRRDEHSTEFGLWLRDQCEIDSALGFVATNIDYLWRNYRTGYWMFIEEMRHGVMPKRWQSESFDLVNKVSKDDPKYKGFHYLIFENTSPEDGTITLDGKEISKDDLIKFLRFE